MFERIREIPVKVLMNEINRNVRVNITVIIDLISLKIIEKGEQLTSGWKGKDG